MCVLRLHLVCHSLGALVNAAPSTASHFNAFWVSMCAEINVPFSQWLCAGCACARAWSYPTERQVRLGTPSDARGGFLPTSPPARWLDNGLLGGLADRLAGLQRLLLPYLVAAVGGGWRRCGGDGGEVVLCLRVGSRGWLAQVPQSKHRSLKDSKGVSESSLHSRQLDGLGLISQERGWWTA